MFKHLGPNDRVDEAARVVYCSEHPSGVPPVCTLQWTRDDWDRFDAGAKRARLLRAEASILGYRFVGC